MHKAHAKTRSTRTRIPREDEAFYMLSGEVVIKVYRAADPLRLSPPAISNVRDHLRTKLIFCQI